MRFRLKFIILLTLFASAISNMIYAQCSYLDTLQVSDFSSEQILLDITGAINNDLSTNGICEVHIKFKHAQLGDFIMDLTSPAGQQVTLVGPSGVYGATNFTVWDVSFVQCGAQAFPDVGFLPQWDNNQFWGSFGSYNGVYYPQFGCLEDFDTGTVDGVWTLDIIDNLQFDEGEILEFRLVFCDPRGIDCAECDKPSIELTEADFEVCIGSGLLDFNPEYSLSFNNPEDSSAFVPMYVISQEDTVLQIVEEVDMRLYPVGEYQICALMAPAYNQSEFVDYFSSLLVSEIWAELSSPTSGYCAVISEHCMTVGINAPPDSVYIEESFCRGDTFFFKKEAFTQDGLYYRTVYPEDNCDTTFVIQLHEIYVKSRILNPSIINCYNPEITLDASISEYSPQSAFQWFTDGGRIVGGKKKATIKVDKAGRYYCIVSEGGCADTSYVDVIIDMDNPVATVHNAVLDCNNKNVRLRANISSGYDSIQWKGPGGFYSEVLRPVVNRKGNYKLIITGNNGCVDSFSLKVSIDTLSPSVTVKPANALCENDIIQLATKETIKPDHSYTWTSTGGFYASVKDTFAQAENATYYIQVVNEVNGCASSDSLRINSLIELPVVSLEATEQLNCYTDSVQILNNTSPDSILFHWSGPAGFKSNEASPYVRIPGVYHLKTETGNTCDVEDSIEVIGDFFLPSIMAFADTIRCLSDTIDLTAYSTDDVIFAWTGPGAFVDTGAIVRAILPGQYIVRAVTSGGCRDSTFVEVVEDFSHSQVVLYSDTLTCDRTVAEVSLISAEVDSFYWYTSNGEFLYDSSFTIKNHGVQFFHFRDVNGCKGVEIIRTIRDRNLPEVEYDIPVFGCADDTARIVLDSEAVSYRWTGPDNFSSEDKDPLIYDAGEYYLEATGWNGCILLDTVLVKYDTIPPLISIRGDNLGCFRDQVRLSITEEKPGMEYSWTGPQGFQSTDARPYITMAGKYLLELTAPNGCLSIGEYIVQLDTLKPVLTIEGDTLRCDNSPVTLSAYANVDDVEFTWMSGNTVVGVGESMETGEPGEYLIIAEAKNTCRDSVLYQLESDFVIPEITILLDSITCSINSVVPVIPSDISELVSYQWTGPDGFTSDSLTPVMEEAGQYIFHFTLPNGCEGQKEVSLIENLALPDDNMRSHYTLNCDNPLIELQPGLSEVYELYWETQSGEIDSASTYIVHEPGRIEFTAVGSNDCVLHKTIEIGIDTLTPVVSIVLDTFNCRVTKIPVEVDAASDAYSYTWKYPDGDSSSMKEPTLTTPGIYIVEVVDTNGCMITTSVNLIADTLAPVFNVEGGSLSCRDSTYQLKLRAASQIETIRWFGPRSFFSTDAEPIIDEVGEYTVTLISPNGCFARDTIYVDDKPPHPIVDIDAYGVDCDADFIQLRIVPVVGEDLSYEWSRDGTAISTSREPILKGDYEYTLSIMDGFSGCLTDTLISLSKDSVLPIATINQLDPILCAKNTARLEVENTEGHAYFNYSWDAIGPGDIISSRTSSMVDIEGAGVYSVLLKDTRNGCVYVDTIRVMEQASSLESIVLDVRENTCPDMHNGKIVINDVIGGIPPYQYALNDIGYSSYGIFDDLGLGDATISVKDKYGCELDTTIIFDESHLIRLTMRPDTIIAMGETVLLRPEVTGDTSNYAFQWSPSDYLNCSTCAYTSAHPLEPIEYTLTIQDSIHCQVVGTRKILFNATPTIYMPNAFTPNGDKMNDMIRPFFADDVREVKLFEIYERRGTVLFSIRNVKEKDFDLLAWDGRVNGKYLSPQVLTYKLIFERKDGMQHQKAGTITLLR